MSPEIQRLLDLALDAPEEARCQLLTEHCTDPGIRAEVESLLDYAGDDDLLIDEAIRGVACSLRSSCEAAPGDVIGTYQILSQIGRGGMGSVYLAERIDGEIRQRVAIKLLRGDGHSPARRRRFLRERQVLADLRHPSIVRLLDAGHTANGRPFLVMEHVEGVPVDVYSESLGVRERLLLFLRICDAVSHAHRHLIIHRDLKPSNILVDASGLPKLLDFGIARLLDEVDDATLTVDRALTPYYASPEQKLGAVQTTATDIYSLGAVLFALLTGEENREKAGARPGETAPSELNAEVPADLDYIVSKALRTEPDERYASVNEFANDIRAALEWRPVQARTGDIWYRTRRFLRRCWGPPLGALLVLVSLAAGLYVANREKSIAQQRFHETRQLAGKLFEIDAQVSQLQGSTKTRQMIVDTALAYLGRVSADAHLDPGLALEIATAYMRAARVQGVNIAPNLGQTEPADRSEAKARALIGRVLTVEPDNLMALLRAAQVAHDRMILSGDRHREDDELAFGKQSLVFLDRYLARKRWTDADHADAQQAIIILINVASHFSNAGRNDQAIEICSRAITLARATNWPTQAGAALMVVALARRDQGNLDEALTAIRESVRLLEPEASESSRGQRMSLALALIREGEILGVGDVHLGRPAEAAQALERALRITDEIAKQDPSDFSSRHRIYTAETKLAAVVESNNPRRAVELYDDALRRLAESRANGGTDLNEARTLALSAGPLMRVGRREEADLRMKDAMQRIRDARFYPLADEPRSETAEILCAYAEYLAATGTMEAAASIYRELVRVLPVDSSVTLTESAQAAEILRASSRMERRAGHPDRAAILQARRVALWKRWAAWLPQNRFARGKLDAALRGD